MRLEATSRCAGVGSAGCGSLKAVRFSLLALLLSLLGCPSTPCVGDACVIAEVDAADDPDAAFALAQTISDPTQRDLVWMALIRQTGWDRCSGLSDDALQERCATTLQRPHLLEGRYAAVGQECGGASGEAADTCRVDAADERLRHGDLEAAATLCAAVEQPRWRDECTFRISEHAPLPERAGWCRKAGEFSDSCFTHLIGALGEDAAADGLAGLVAAAAESQQVLQRPDGPPRADPAVYWWIGLQVVAAAAAADGGLAGFRAAASQQLPDEQQFRAQILADVIAVRQGVQRQLSLGGDLPTQAELLSIRAREPWPDGTAGVTIDSNGVHRARTAAELREGQLVRRFHLGRVPEVLECHLETAVRQEAAVVWALEVFDWSVAAAGIRAGLASDSQWVRSATIDSAVERGLNRHRHGATPEWLLAALESLSTPHALAAASGLRALKPVTPPTPSCRR